MPISHTQPSPHPRRISIPIDSSDTGEALRLTLDRGCMIEGDFDSRKTDLLHALVLNGAGIYSPRELTFRLADCKQGGLAFRDYRDISIPHIACVRTGVTPRDLLEFLEEASAIIDARVNRLQEVNVLCPNRRIRNGDEYNEWTAETDGYEPMGYILVAVNEIQQALINCADAYTPAPSWEYAVTAEQLSAQLHRIARMGPSVHVHTMLLADRQPSNTPHRFFDGYLPYCTDRFLFRTKEEILQSVLPGSQTVTEERHTAISDLPDTECIWLREAFPPRKLHVREIPIRERRDILEQIRKTYSV